MNKFVLIWLFVIGVCAVWLVLLLRAKDKDRWLLVAQAFAGIAIPLFLGASGWQIQSQLSENANQKDYVQVAIAILREPPPADAKAIPPLRCWALAVVKLYSPVKLRPEEEEQFVRSGFGAGFGAGFSPDAYAKGCPERV
jgi:hypothetical protein